MIWGLRLSGFLLFRILKTGKDDRFDDKRDDFFKFLAFWIFQMAWVWVVSLPVTILNSPNVQQYPQHAFGTGRDIAGIIIYTIRLTMETIYIASPDHVQATFTHVVFRSSRGMEHRGSAKMSSALPPNWNSVRALLFEMEPDIGMNCDFENRIS
jgi:hypothetical protein